MTRTDHVHGNLRWNRYSNQFVKGFSVETCETVEDALYLLSNIWQSIQNERDSAIRKTDNHNEIVATGGTVVYDRNGWPINAATAQAVKVQNRTIFVSIHDLSYDAQWLAGEAQMHDAREWAKLARFALAHGDLIGFDYCCECWADFDESTDYDENPLCSPFIRASDVPGLSPDNRREWIARSELR